MTCRKKITFSLVLLTLALILAVVFIPPAGSSLDEVEIADSTQGQQIVYQYGIPVDDYQVDYGIVQRNQTLSVILEQHGLTPRNVHDLTQKAKGVSMYARSGPAKPMHFSSRRTARLPPYLSSMSKTPNRTSSSICGATMR